MGDTLSGDQEKRVKRLKRVLEGWRVVLLKLKPVLLWEQPWHPAVILGVLTIIYFLLWLLDPNSITLIASIGLIVNFVDFLVPLVSAHLMSATTWSGSEEKQLDELCRSLVLAYSVVADNAASFIWLRNNKPLVYYAVSISALFVLLWLGKSVNNGHLLFIILSALCMLPGLLNRGLPLKLQSAMGGLVSAKKEK